MDFTLIDLLFAQVSGISSYLQKCVKVLGEKSGWECVDKSEYERVRVGWMRTEYTFDFLSSFLLCFFIIGCVPLKWTLYDLSIFSANVDESPPI